MAEASTPKVYDPVGQCIYCGRCDVALRKEHIIPFALAGNHSILPASSCVKCADFMNKAFERDCLQKIFGSIRIRRDFPTRNPKERPTILPMRIEIDGREEVIQTPVQYRPDLTFLYAFPHPGVLLGLTPEQSAARPIPARWRHGKRSKEYWEWAAAKGATKHGVRALFSPTAFGKFLGKMGHAYAVAELGLNKFVPVLPKGLLGEEPWLPYHYVGGNPEQVPASEFTTEIGLRPAKNLKGKLYQGVEIRLFGDAGAPIYRVVVGPLL